VRRVSANDLGLVDIRAAYGAGKRVAYAFCYIQSDKPQQVRCYVGTDDSAKIWVNGAEKLEVWKPEGRACHRGENTFSFEAKEGLNSVLVKVEDHGGRWEFIVEACDESGEAARQARLARKAVIRAFQSAELAPKNGGFVRPRGPLPEIEWKEPDVVEPVLGDAALSVTWYRELRRGPKTAFRKVKSAKRPGRYAAVVEAVSEDGIQVRRKLSFLCVAENWRPPVARLRAYAEAMPMHKLYEYDLAARADAIAEHRTVPEEGFGSELDAILLATVERAEACEWPLRVSDRFGVANGDSQLALRSKLEGRKAKPILRMPRRRDGCPATVLHDGTLESAGVSADAPERLRSFCEEWYEASREPFAILIARHGVVVIHEAFGDTTVDTPMWMASISKLMTGVMFVQFVDQGILGIDEPVGHYLPDFPIQGEKVVTLRQCFTHTSGLEGHTEGGGVYNQYIDNVLANGMEVLSPGTEFVYNGMGHNLAGKVMEIAGGKSILRTMYENFLGPLGMHDTTAGHLGSGCCSTAENMARLGQLLLNRGSYGELEFFSPETFKCMLPTDLSKLYPDIRLEIGLSIGWMRERADNAGENGVPADATYLSRNVVGHGAASGAIFRVDLDNDLVIVQTRNQGGPEYGKFTHGFFRTIDECLVE